ncbi:ABC transporter ATP-binding protein [Bradyrhizobium sp. NP1]|uniref:ABC transporter ATP-binding protein n=1 Tax=Bradyrhizobium sp. NP1 TaxID=3049772 RepID=UPI0025A4D509|nr:ABC transporter ATP-binding protein [Bradyrhizobium sp. NP1]WJR76626.1 ABC transporter ATP-binding protein [Bradyrhizobium sp. NP1]
MTSGELEISNLTKSFGGVQALAGVDLKVGAGETVGVIGPNGSGKTTLFNAITGIVAADGGSARWKQRDVDLLKLRPWEIFAAGIARTFQNIRLSPGQSILENVLVGCHLVARTGWWSVLCGLPQVKRHDESARQRAIDALEFVARDLAATPNRLAGELSYADRRRVEFARALVSGPDLLLLDEPTAGMNPRETEEIGDDIRKIAERGLSILVIEHKMKFVASLASRIAVLNFGKKIAEGSYDQVRSDPTVIASYLGRKGDHLSQNVVGEA